MSRVWDMLRLAFQSSPGAAVESPAVSVEQPRGAEIQYCEDCKFCLPSQNYPADRSLQIEFALCAAFPTPPEPPVFLARDVQPQKVFSRNPFTFCESVRRRFEKPDPRRCPFFKPAAPADSSIPAVQNGPKL